MEKETKFNLRKLEARDLFPLSTIMSKVGVRQLKGIFKQAFENSNEENRTAANFDVAIDIAGILLDNLEKCEQHIYRFLASLSGMKENDIATLPPADFIELIIEVVTKEDFKDFFKVASRFVK